MTSRNYVSSTMFVQSASECINKPNMIYAPNLLNIFLITVINPNQFKTN